MANTKVQTTSAGEVEVAGGKEIIADNLQGFTDGDKIVAFSYADRAKFKFNKENKHMPDGIADLHVIDAAAAEKLGLGKIVK
jgi:hypothetical protein